MGFEVAELLAQRYAGISDLAEATQDQLTEIPGIGPKIAESIAAYFSVPLNRTVIEKLARAGVDPRREVVDVSPDSMPLHGMTFVITGTLTSLLRREAESRIKALGGSAASSVTRKTNYLVAGESSGSKLEAARRLDTPVLDEAAFLELLRSADAEAEPEERPG